MYCRVVCLFATNDLRETVVGLGFAEPLTLVDYINHLL